MRKKYHSGCRIFSVVMDERLYAQGEYFKTVSQSLTHSEIYCDGLEVRIKKFADKGLTIPDNVFAAIKAYKQDIIRIKELEIAELDEIERKCARQASNTLAGKAQTLPKRSSPALDPLGRPWDEGEIV